MSKLAIGTRFWGVDRARDFPRIRAFIQNAKHVGQVLVAVNAAEDKIETINAFPDVAFAVTPWGKFVQPLNALILRAISGGANHLLLASAEFPPTADQTQGLMNHMDKDTLVVGAAFAEHEFQKGVVVFGTGTTVPWNTFALWNLAELGKLGVPLVGDAPFNPKMAGVEELATIAIYQKLWPGLQAKVVKVLGVGGEWNTEGWDTDRLEKHRQKIQSKKDRPTAQLDHLGLSGSTLIIHI